MPIENMSLGPGMVYIPDDPMVLKPIDLVTSTVDYPEARTFKTKPFECELKGQATINPTLLKELAVPSKGPQPFDMYYETTRLEQIRKHKKKRINKKWANRYGHREVPIRYIAQNCYLRHNTFNDFDIVVGSSKVVKKG